ncbi:YhcN/YlaJ family sporulation lipoprotein [Paenibacillus sp. LjRoot56]|uniref:YhcN/YlaJ family sporulation lipoprotein n=1 Tax=Paenibacillus sp. LjRoot56 TaxID=3342333 RepID=UPI003ECD906E
MFRKLGFPICGIIFLLLTLSACGSSGKQYRGDRDDSTSSNFGANVEKGDAMDRAYQVQQLSGPVTHNNTKLEYSQNLSDQLNNMDGVNTALVMITNQNAYVALMMDSSAIGTKGLTKETNNQGTNKGFYNDDNPYDDSLPSNDLNKGYNSYETAVHHDLLSHQFKQAIAEKLRVLKPDLMDVYISANRDFLNKMNSFAQESWKGHSLMPLLTDFNQTVTRVFGTAQSLPHD